MITSARQPLIISRQKSSSLRIPDNHYRKFKETEPRPQVKAVYDRQKELSISVQELLLRDAQFVVRNCLIAGYYKLLDQLI